jgi:phenylacetate-CoA ligase
MWALHLTLRHTQWLPRAEIEAGQVEQLRTVLAHATAHAAGYRDVVGATAIDGITSLADLRRLPILSPQARAEHAARLQTDVLPEDMPQTAPRRWWAALALRDLEWCGFDPAEAAAFIRPGDAVGLLGQKLLEGASLPDWGAPFEAIETGRGHVMDARQDVGQQLDWLARVRPRYLFVRSGHLGRLAEADRRVDSLRAVHALGEPLSDTVRASAEAVFGVPVTSTLSSDEAGYLASPCPDRAGWHVHEESVILEVLDDGGAPCRTGRVVVTTLQDFRTPLIRYDTGHVAEARGMPCPCGRALTALTRYH